MARLAAILVTLAKLSWRDLRRFNSLGTNNFFLFVMLIFGMQPANAFLPMLLGLILLFPLSADPLGRVPADRLGHWPLSKLERLGLRAGSLLMSPIAWITLGLLLWGLRSGPNAMELGWRFLLLGVGIAVLTYLFTALPARLPQLNVLRLIPVPRQHHGGDPVGHERAVGVQQRAGDLQCGRWNVRQQMTLPLEPHKVGWV